MMTKCTILISITFASFSFSQTIDNSATATLRSEAIKKYSIRANADKQREAIPTSVYYSVVLREAVYNIGRWESFNDQDVQVLKTLHSPRSKFFMEEDAAEISALCKTLPTSLSDSAIIELATQYADEKSRSERRIESYYKNQINKLSRPAQQHLETRIDELKNSDQIGYGTIDIESLAKEFPSVAYGLVESRCLSVNAGRQEADLKDIYIISEEAHSTAIQPNK